MAEPSIFTRIIAGELPAKILYEDEQCVVIPDINPQATTHLLIIPRKPLLHLGQAQEQDKPLLGHLLWVAAEMARKLQLDNGFRLVVNNGAGAGQTVDHLHIHLLSKKGFAESDLSQ